MKFLENFSSYSQKTISILFAAALLTNCSNNNESSSYKDQIASSSVNSDTIKVEVLSQSILKSIPSPVEINTYIKETKINYNKSILCDYNLANEYITTHKKALALGVYSSDLAYINIHKKYRDAVGFVEAVRWLTNELDISNLFDIEKIKFYSENLDKNDSIMFLLAKDFDFMTTYLNEHQKSDDAVLVIMGGFIESLHIAVSIYEDKPIPTLREKILEQKLVMDDIISILNQFKESGQLFQNLHQEMESLKTVFDEVNIETTYGESEMIENEEGELVVVDNSSTKVIASEETLLNLIDKIKLIRSKAISL